MADEAERARKAAVNFEARLMGFKKTRDSKGTWVEVRYQVFPQDVPQALQLADLGTRYQIAAVEIGDDERPVMPRSKPNKPKRKWDELRPSEQAGIACTDEAFQEWAARQWHKLDDAPGYVRAHCRVSTSRSELDTNPEAAQRWHDLYARFQRETGRVAEERR